MDGDPGHVIRSLRLALEMSQAEFARAAGWSPSTISSWERGRAKPSRLAFKTILAFAEERGVRYRPPSPGSALVPMTPTRHVTGAPPRPDAVGRIDAPRDDAAARSGPSLGPRAALRPLVYPHLSPEHPPEGTGVRVGGTLRDTAHAVHTPRWSAEARFRLTLGSARAGAHRGVPRGVLELAVVLVAFAIALGVAPSVRRFLAPPARVTSTTSAASMATFGGQRAIAAVDIANAGAAAAPARPALVEHPTRAPASAAPAREERSLAAAPPVARLESVMAVGGDARATFRTANDAVTVVPGDWLGAQQVAAIGGDGVTLVDRAGATHRVYVGQHTPFE